MAKMRAGEVELHAVEGAAERAEIRAVGCKRKLLDARAAVAEATVCYMTAKAAAEVADVQAKTLRLEADDLNKPAPTADTEPASSAKRQRTVATQTEGV